MPDITLSASDRRRFLNSLMSTFHTPSRASNVLEDIGFPPGRLPPNDGTVEGIWREALRELEAGRIPNGLRTLLGLVLEMFPANSTWVELAQRYAPELLPDGSSAHAEQAATARACHVMIRTADAAARRSALEFLRARRLEPTEVWSTSHMTLFAVREENPDRLRELLAGANGLEWTVIPPGGQTYLFSQLTVQGPDGRHFRFTDVPAQQTVAGLAADLVFQYPDHDADRRTVTDRVQADGRGARLGPEASLHDAGVRDGDRLRVGSAGSPAGPGGLLTVGYVFISYTREDAAGVDRLQAALEASHIRVWRDTANLWPGEDWRAKIRQAITKDALVFLACFSRHSLARRKGYQNEELALAIQQMRLRRPGEPWLIPVRFDDCEIPDLEIDSTRSLSSIQRADLFGNDFQASAAKLSAAILRILESREES